MESRQQMIEQENFLLSADKENVKEAINRIKSSNASCDLSNLNLTSEDFNYLLSLAELKTMISEMEELDISNNQIKTLSQDISGFNNLTLLDILNNGIETLSGTISLLQKLTDLNISDNQIQVLPPEFFDLRNLEAVFISSNRIRELPREISNLENLKRLNVSDNQIQRLSSETGLLQKLTHLDISGNQIEELPQAIAQLRQLRKFDARGNPLTRETRNFLTRNPHLRANYNMAAFDTIRDWNDVLNDTSLKGDQEIVKIIQDSEGLQKFLSRSGIDSKERKDALDYLLEKIKNQSTREETAALMIAATGDCSTPIHDCLANAYFEMCKERRIAIDENIIAKMTINAYLEKKIITRLKQSEKTELSSKDKIILESGESIEQKHALLNALLLNGGENEKHNKCKIDIKPYLLSTSDTANIEFAYTILTHEAAQQCAKLFCQTDENGNLLKNPNNGHYIADKAKYDNVIENFKANFLEDKAEAKQIYDELILILSNQNNNDEDHRETEPSYYGLSGTESESMNVIRDALGEMRSQTPIQNISAEDCLGFLYRKYSNVSSQKGQQGIEEELKSSHDRPMQEKGNRILQQVAEMINPQQQQNNTRNIIALDTLEQNTVGASRKRRRLDNHDSREMIGIQSQQNNPIAVNQSTSEQIASRLHPVHNQSQMQQQYATYNQNQQQYSNQRNEQFAVNQSTSQQMSQSSFSQREIQQRMQEEFNERYGNPDSAAKTLGYDR